MPKVVANNKANIVRGINTFFFLVISDVKPKTRYIKPNRAKNIKSIILSTVSIPLNDSMLFKKNMYKGIYKSIVKK